MKLELGNTELKINVSFAAAVTLMLILDESGVCAVALLCCIVHELGHIMCLLVMGEQPKLIELSFYGIKLERRQTAGIKSIAEIAVYASGPAVNLIFSAALFLISEAVQGMKTAAVISLGVGLFNLIPCRPLDGGNILFAAICRHADEEKSERICRMISASFLLLIGIAGCRLLIKNKNFTLLGVGIYLAAALLFDKNK
ncbi:MAG: site-2 protease family protein [Clostridia bacterium]|nr:site-2 protease family protein [Clostridia bacterium]